MTARSDARSDGRSADLRYWLAAQRGPLLAAALFVAMFGLFIAKHPAGLSGNVVNTDKNFTPFVVVDRELVTAQNPMSDHELAAKFIEVLGKAV